MTGLSLNEIADIIISSVYGGLKTPTNYSLSDDQVKAEIVTTRNRVIHELLTKGGIDRRSITQSVNCIQLAWYDMVNCCEVKVKCPTLRSKEPIPKLLYLPNFDPIDYAGEIKRFNPFKVNYGVSYIYSKHDRFTGNKPTIWVDTNNYLYLFNPPGGNFKDISITAVFENPLEANKYSCVCSGEDDPFPAPSYIIDMITGKLIESYIRMFQRMNPMPNTQADILPTQQKTK